MLTRTASAAPGLPNVGQYLTYHNRCTGLHSMSCVVPFGHELPAVGSVVFERLCSKRSVLTNRKMLRNHA